jgi:multiple sugar transport system permease protein
MTTVDLQPPATGRKASPAGTPGHARSLARLREQGLKWAFLMPALAYVLLFFGYPIVKNIVMGSQDYTTRTFYTGQAPWVGFANYLSFFKSTLFSSMIANTDRSRAPPSRTARPAHDQLLLALFFTTGSRWYPAALAAAHPVAAAPDRIHSGMALDTRSGQRRAEPGPAEPAPDRDPGTVAEQPRRGAALGDHGQRLDRIPFNVALLYGGLQGIPEERYEAASLEGATGWRAFRYITWPALRPVINVVLVLGVIYTLKVVDIILGLTGGGPANATQTLATTAYQDSFIQFSFGQGAAVSNLLIAISLIFAVIYLRASRRSPDEQATAMNLSRTRQASYSVIGVVLLAVMLFPVYWMVNASLQPSGGGVSTTFFPTHLTLEGYRLALSQQSRNILTSVIISLGTVVLSLAIAAPAAYALAKFRLRGGNVIRFALLITDDPRHRDRQLAVSRLQQHRPAQQQAGSRPGRCFLGHPIRDPDHLRLHGVPADGDRGGRPCRRRGPLPGVPLDRPARQPQRHHHGGTVQLPVQLERFPVRADADDRDQRAAGDPRHLRLPQQQRRVLGPSDGHRRAIRLARHCLPPGGATIHRRRAAGRRHQIATHDSRRAACLSRASDAPNHAADQPPASRPQHQGEQ